MKLLLVCKNPKLQERLDRMLAKVDAEVEITHIDRLSDVKASLDGSDDVSMVLVNMDAGGDLACLQTLQREREDIPFVVFSDPTGVDAGMSKTLLQALLGAGHASDNCSGPRDEPKKATDDAHAAAQRHALTPRQADVLALIRLGKSNKQIADMLEMAEGTVKIHCMAIFRALGVANRTQAAMVADRVPYDSSEPEPAVGD